MEPGLQPRGHEGGCYAWRRPSCLGLGFFVRGGLLLSARQRLRTEPLREPLDAAFRVDQLLLAREERVAGVADFEMEFLLGRAGLELVPARATGLDT